MDPDYARRQEASVLAAESRETRASRVEDNWGQLTTRLDASVRRYDARQAERAQETRVAQLAALRVVRERLVAAALAEASGPALRVVPTSGDDDIEPYRETPAEVDCPDSGNACRRIDCRDNGCGIERWDE